MGKVVRATSTGAEGTLVDIREYPGEGYVVTLSTKNCHSTVIFTPDLELIEE